MIVAASHRPGSRRRPEPDRALREDGHDIANPNSAGFRTTKAGREDIEAHEDLFVRSPSGTGARLAIASGTSRYSTWAPSIVVPKRQPRPFSNHGPALHPWRGTWLLALGCFRVHVTDTYL
jgi:hypothetical protein